MNHQSVVCFSHGKESGPWGVKISALAKIARLKGFSAESPDYSKQPDPDARVKQLLSLRFQDSNLTVLVGSSMGGYVATVASQIINPVGLFLMAPAFYLPGYKEQSPVPHARKTVIVHGLNDEIVPVENSVRFAREHTTELHLIAGDHSLNDQLPKIGMLFDLFLDEVLELSDLPKILTWEKIAQKFVGKNEWVAQIWKKMALAGHASYRNEAERKTVLIRFIALTNFYYEFLEEFSRDLAGREPQGTATIVDLPNEILDNLLADFIARRGSEFKTAPTIETALEEIAKDCIYPTITKYFRDADGLATSIYRASYPTFYDEDAEEFLADPEDIDAEEKGKARALEEIHSWLNEKFCSNSVL